MKKLLIGVVVVLLAAAAGAPYVNGLVMEHAVRNSIENANQIYGRTGNGVSLEIVRYDRGYSSSRFVWKIHLGDLQRFYGTREIAVVDTANQGLTGVVLHTDLRQNTWFADFVRDRLGGRNPLHITTHYNLFGNFRTTVAVDGFTMPVKKDIVNVKPASVHFTINQNLKALAIDGHGDGLAVAGKATVGAFTLKGDSKKVSTFIWDGQYSLAVRSIEASENGKSFQATDLKMSGKSDYDRKTRTLGMETSYGVGSVTSLGKKVIGNGFIRFGIDKINVQGYEEFIKTYSANLQKMVKRAAQAGNAPRQQRQFMRRQAGLMGLQLMASSEKLLKKGLRFRIEDVKATLPEGKLNGNFSLALKQDITFAQLGMVVQDPSLALKLFSLHSDISLPASLVGNDAGRLTTPLFGGMKTGLFVRHGDMLINKTDTRDGKLILNGSEVAL